MGRRGSVWAETRWKWIPQGPGSFWNQNFDLPRPKKYQTKSVKYAWTPLGSTLEKKAHALPSFAVKPAVYKKNTIFWMKTSFHETRIQDSPAQFWEKCNYSFLNHPKFVISCICLFGDLHRNTTSIVVLATGSLGSGYHGPGPLCWVELLCRWSYRSCENISNCIWNLWASWQLVQL